MYRSGPPEPDFAGGWALLAAPRRGREVLAHCWDPVERIDAAPDHTPWRSLCGVIGSTTYTYPALEPGNYPRCLSCVQRERK